MSTAGSASSFRLGLAAERCGRSNATMLWPRRKAAPSASASSFVSAAASRPAFEREALSCIGADRSEAVDARVLDADFEVEAEAARCECLGDGVGHRPVFHRPPSGNNAPASINASSGTASTRGAIA